MTTIYKRIDRQGTCSDSFYRSKDDLRDQLRDFHGSDCSFEEQDQKAIKRMELEELLDFGEWEIEEVKTTPRMAERLLDNNF